MDWDKIRDEYLSDPVSSYRKLSAKYHISYNAVWRRAKAEHWHELKKKTEVEAASLAAEAIAAQKGENAADVIASARRLLYAFDCTVATMAASGGMTPKHLKDMGDALVAIQKVLDSRPTELDIAEQQARIDKLRKDAAAEDDGPKEVVVQMKGALGEYA